MGGLLRGHVDVRIWGQIQSSEIWEIEDKLKVMAILKLIYYHLPAHLKPCFEYCSLFPKSHMFCKTDLVKLWIAQGFIQSNIGHDTMEEAGIAYFSELLVRSFSLPRTPHVSALNSQASATWQHSTAKHQPRGTAHAELITYI